MGVYERVIIYWDVLWLLNFIMDFLLLSITATILRWPHQFVRVTISAVAGASFTLLLLWVEMTPFIVWLYKIALALLMVRIAFPLKSLKELWRGSLIFYLCAWVAGGILYSFAPSATWYSGILFWLLSLFALLIALGLLTFWRNQGQKQAWQAQLFVTMPAGEVKVPALVDSGNRLSCPLTGNPVIIVEYKALAHLLPPAWIEGTFETAATEATELAEESLRPRYIPYTAMGTSQGLLLGFRPTKAELIREDEVIQCCNAIVALSHQRLDPAGQYEALVPTAWDS
ncbi:sigma-E processing peptidase SpoIIGA [Heliorestis acidaminivorans]|uniref:Sporulation sigma-E factor-processing peptidase n=1 Tax=Heliorestis acidaminivorans TaxID=553427 RepID=A0A6I0FAK1_9FIRM|nr:sigma-E processing peptidase SpoIIGA [Heliorestis acidaminivorans]KAB2954518.1 sigma-E processing peptidase SpoIIGA [Heliorestis acidaminivorans]